MRQKSSRFGPDENPSGQRWQIGMHQQEQEVDTFSVAQTLANGKCVRQVATLAESGVAK